MPKSITATPGGQLALAQPPGDLAAEAVVAQPGVADAGDQDLLLTLGAHDSITSTSGAKKNR